MNNAQYFFLVLLGCLWFFFVSSQLDRIDASISRIDPCECRLAP